MKKLLTILFCLIGLATFGQTPLKTKQITADTARLKNLTVNPVLLSGYGTLFVKNDSLHFESPVKDWNLGKIVYQDSLGYYVMRSDSTTVFATPTQVAKSQNNFVQKNELGSAAMADVSQFVQVKDPIKVVIATNGENGIVIPKYLDTSTKIFYNGYFIDSSFWTGIGTNILTVALDTRIYDTILITN
jgi:hypothetical protein